MLTVKIRAIAVDSKGREQEIELHPEVTECGRETRGAYRRFSGTVGYEGEMHFEFVAAGDFGEE
jgi:hypothetical protein